MGSNPSKSFSIEVFKLARKKKVEKKGRVSVQDLMNIVNKKAGMNVAHDLTNENPTEVKEWIPTGSYWLDSIICRGKIAGIPVGKITEIAGLEATGKSYMACQIAANAQKKGIVRKGDGLHIDHKDGNVRNNNSRNLRVVRGTVNRRKQ